MSLENQMSTSGMSMCFSSSEEVLQCGASMDWIKTVWSVVSKWPHALNGCERRWRKEKIQTCGILLAPKDMTSACSGRVVQKSQNGMKNKGWEHQLTRVPKVLGTNICKGQAQTHKPWGPWIDDSVIVCCLAPHAFLDLVCVIVLLRKTWLWKQGMGRLTPQVQSGGGPGAEWRRARCSSDSSLIQCTQALLWGTLSQTHHPPPLAGEVMCGWHTHSVWWMCWVGTRVWPGSKDSQEGVEWMSSLRNPIQNCSKNSRKQTCNKPQLFIFDGITQSKALEAGNFGMSRLPKFLSEHAKASHIDRAAAVDATPKKCHGRRSDDFRQKRLSSTLHLSSVREFLCSL